MTPKEKAEELIYKMWVKIPAKYTPVNEQIEDRKNGTNDMEIAKQCALIAVDEIIEAIPIHNPIAVEPLLYFWQEVKQEIEKL